ncbi:MAG TPA: hypothetical protein VFE05_00480 [Longimicrobiaceae bacterium]|jgi:hypothetical protein|nr:hypothetical protein [Longimicrobiaceae bacterium]
MKLLLVAGVIIVLPGLVALIYAAFSGNHFLLHAAMFSVGLNLLPFIAGALLMRGKNVGTGH